MGGGLKKKESHQVRLTEKRKTVEASGKGTGADRAKGRS